MMEARISLSSPYLMWDEPTPSLWDWTIDLHPETTIDSVSDPPDVATSLGNLAAFFRAPNRDKEAEPLEQRATKIRTIKRGSS